MDIYFVFKDLGGNGNGIVISIDYDGIIKGFKCFLVCDWLRKCIFFYDIFGD